MSTKMIGPIVFGAAGCAVLVSLGVWQVQRLAWKTEMLDGINARIMAAPVALPDDPVRGEDTYLPVTAPGTFGEGVIRVLVSQKQVGAGYRLISPFRTAGRTVLVDRGIVPTDAPQIGVPVGEVTLTGNLHWPEETDSFTPEPDMDSNIWFARDVARMAQHLGTEPVLIILRDQPPGDRARPLAVGAEGIPNDHLQYAVTWFSLAVIWLGMTLYLLWRIRQRTV